GRPAAFVFSDEMCSGPRRAAREECRVTRFVIPDGGRTWTPAALVPLPLLERNDSTNRELRSHSKATSGHDHGVARLEREVLLQIALLDDRRVVEGNAALAARVAAHDHDSVGVREAREAARERKAVEHG